MKIVTIPEKFLNMNNKPIKRIKRNDEGEPCIKKDKDGNPVYVKEGQTVFAIWEYENETFLESLKDFLDGLFIYARDKNNKLELKMDDATNTHDIFRAIHVVANHKLEIENHPYDWLMKKLDEYGVPVMGKESVLIKEVFSKAEDGGVSRPEKRREEKAKK